MARMSRLLSGSPGLTTRWMPWVVSSVSPAGGAATEELWQGAQRDTRTGRILFSKCSSAGVWAWAEIATVVRPPGGEKRACTGTTLMERRWRVQPSVADCRQRGTFRPVRMVSTLGERFTIERRRFL